MIEFVEFHRIHAHTRISNARHPDRRRSAVGSGRFVSDNQGLAIACPAATTYVLCRDSVLFACAVLEFVEILEVSNSDVHLAEAGWQQGGYGVQVMLSLCICLKSQPATSFNFDLDLT